MRGITVNRVDRLILSQKVSGSEEKANKRDQVEEEKDEVETEDTEDVQDEEKEET